MKNRAADAVVFHFDLGGQLIAESDQYGNILHEYIYLGYELVGLADDSGALHYVHTGYRCEPKAVTNAAGTVIWKAIYEPFGKATVDEDPDGNGVSYTLNVRLPGQYYDSETGHHYNYMRNYAPDLGRFLTTDPIGFAGKDLNLYAYCWNDPVNWVDPTGLDGFSDVYQGVDRIFWTIVLRFGLGIGAAMSGLGSRIAVIFIIVKVILSFKRVVDIAIGFATVVNLIAGAGSGVSAPPVGNHAASSSDNASDSGGDGEGDEGGGDGGDDGGDDGGGGKGKGPKPPSLEDLRKAANADDRNGHTQAGRSLAKKAGRPNSAYDLDGANPNNPKEANARASKIVDEILNNPKSKIVPNERGGWDVISPDGRVMRYNRDGSFQGFREPGYGK